VEIRSENDYGPAAEREISSKRADYFAAGTLVVWDVDLLGGDTVRVFRSTDPENPNGLPIRSENDYGPAAEREMAAKRADYFAAGTLVVWDVDLLGDETVRVFRSSDPENPTVYRRGEHAEAEPAVPTWKMPVDELFR
jgi:Uma2 family endonuclease